MESNERGNCGERDSTLNHNVVFFKVFFFSSRYIKQQKYHEEVTSVYHDMHCFNWRSLSFCFFES